MQITEVRIKLTEDSQERLLAFCSVTFDGSFVVRDLKVIQGARGIFVAMPSRKLTDHCPRCHSKNHLRASYCNECGAQLSDDRSEKDHDGRAKLYADIAHPINAGCREEIQDAVIAAYEREIVLAQDPAYVSTYDDYGEDRYASIEDETFEEQSRRPIAIRDGEKRHRIDPPQSGGRPERRHDERPRQTQNARRSHQRSEEFGEGLF